MKYTHRILAVAALLCLGACRKDKDKFDGPSISDIYSSFKVLAPFKASRDSVDFSKAENVVFTAQFSKIVEWTITVTGSKSKSVKTFSGNSKTIDATNATWDGSTSTFPMFGKENCVATLTIKDITDTFTVNEKIIGVKTIPGYIIADFESGLKPGWVKFSQTGANMDFQVKTDTLAPEGGKYFNMAGTVNWDWLIGLLDFPATAYGTAKTFPLNANPDAVYFNCLVYGTSAANPSLILFQLREDENGDGTFDANTEDQYDYEVRVDWTGWKLVSVKYKDLATLVNGAPATPKGNGLHNPDKLSKVSMLHLANPNDGFASAKLDLIVFTDNGPLKP
ncbi:MAG: hypothetical protein RL660_904 [Bacteroidota bacterium]|jgi:hypothetical protein